MTVTNVKIGYSSQSLFNGTKPVKTPNSATTTKSDTNINKT